MIHSRVDALLAQLGEAGVWIDPHREDSGFGRFAWIRDCDDNRLELWQPLPFLDTAAPVPAARRL